MAGQDEDLVVDSIDNNNNMDVDTYPEDLFAVDKACSDLQKYMSLDDCINASYASELHSIASFIRGHKKKKRKSEHLKPAAFVRLNSRRGKPKPVTIRALLDSGSSGTMIDEKFASKLKSKKDPKGKTEWSTPAGTVTTGKIVTTQFTIPELQDDKLIEWDCHVIPGLGLNYDMIIGRDLLEFAGIDIKFSSQTVEWNDFEMPFKAHDCQLHDAYNVNDGDNLEDMTDRIKKILDAKYEPADLDEVVQNQTQLSDDEKQKLSQLSHKYEDLFARYTWKLLKWR